MNVILANSTNAGGGAAIACRRFLGALRLQGVNVHLLAQKKKANLLAEEKVVVNGPLQKMRYGIRHVNNQKKLKGYTPTNIFCIDRYGYPLEQHPLVKEADVVHLHWVSDSFVNAESIEKLAKQGKKIFWTLHDMHPFTGGCHYAAGCQGFQNRCGNCPQLQSNEPNDPSRKQLEYMLQHLNDVPLNIIGPSKWMAGVASESTLLRDKRIVAIPNTLDFSVFSGRSNEQRIQLRKKWGIPENAFVLVFGAFAADQVRRKGFHLLAEALQIVFNRYGNAANMHLAVFGSENKAPLEGMAYPVSVMGHLQGDHQVVDALSVGDAFVIPSLEDNLPNTVMEAMACCQPVVAFPTGGIPEMVDHGNTGWIAGGISAEHLAEGIVKVRELIEDGRPLGSNARAYAQLHFSQKLVAQRHVQQYMVALES